MNRPDKEENETRQRPESAGESGGESVPAGGTPNMEILAEQKMVERKSLVKLAARFKSGEKEAFNQMAEHLGKRAYYMALKAIGAPDIAEDIAQDSLVKVYHYIHRLNDLNTVMSWHYRIVLNLINDYYRKLSRGQKAGEKLAQLKELEVRGRERKLNIMEREELAKAIQDALAQLDEKHRTVFILKELQNESHADIAGMLDIPVGTVWSRLCHARRKLQAYLEARGFTA